MAPHRFLDVAKPSPPLLLPPHRGAVDDDQPSIIHLGNLAKTYDIGTPQETKALRGVDLDISSGEIVIIFGPSGSGKSTLLNILAGLDKPTTGAATVVGKDLLTMNNHDLALYHQRQVGMVFQSYNLIPTLTVIQNITMPARLAGLSRPQYMARGRQLLRQFKLEELATRLPEECSGGQQQRVGIMRAFANRPALIIADEPTGNLDSANTQLIMDLFRQLNAETNTTMLIVTHDPTLFAIADRVVQFLDGKVVKQIILTPRAKIDIHKVKVPIEFRYQETDAVMEEMGGSRIKQAEEEDEAARKRKEAARRQELEKLLTEEKKKMEEAWRKRLLAAQQGQAAQEQWRAVSDELKRKQQQLQAKEAFLAAEIARVNEALRKQTALQTRLAAATAAVEEQRQAASLKEHQLLSQEWQHKEERAAIASKRLELAIAKKRLDEHVRRLAEDQKYQQQIGALPDVAALEAQQKELAAQRRALQAQAQQLERRQAKVEAERTALEEEKKHFEQEVQTRLAVASNIVEHEREQLETERRRQADAQAERAQAMERKLAAASKIIDYEKAKLTVEYELIAQEKKRLEDARQKLRDRRPEGTIEPPLQPDTALAKLLAERSQFSAAAQHILGVIDTLLTPTQKNQYTRQHILRLVEGVEYRLYGIFNQIELQAFLHRRASAGGAGLNVEAAETLAAAIENMISLGRFSL